MSKVEGEGGGPIDPPSLKRSYNYFSSRFLRLIEAFPKRAFQL